MRIQPSRMKRHALIWLAILTVILVAVQRIAVTLDVAAWDPQAHGGGLTHTWTTNILALWSLCLLLGACYLLRKAQGEREEWETVFRSLGPDVLIVVGPDGVIVMCSPAVQAMYGYGPGEVIGRRTDLLYRLQPSAQGGMDMGMAIARFGFHVGVGLGVRRNGEEFPVETVTSRLQGRRGNVVLIRDISERERARAEIVRARDEAEAANAAKGKAMAELEASYRKLVELEGWRDNLSHLVVHDIKHAVGGIDGSLQLLRRQLGPDIGAEAGRFLACAHDFTDDLANMASLLLDIARLEAARMPIRKVACEMGEIIEDVVKRASGLARLKNVEIETRISPAVVVCDKDMIARVVFNLLSNALQFAPEQTVVTVDCRPDDGVAVVGISDRGPGVPTHLQPRIFEKFNQVNAGGGNGGAGLGLTFCRLAVEAHGGSIGIQSPLNTASNGRPGSRFWFRVPIA